MNRVLNSVLWQRYNTLLKERPVTTKVASTFTLNMIGDTICQLLMHQRKDKEPFKWDVKRSLRQSLIISIGYTPVMHFYLSRVTPLINVSPRITTSKKATVALRTFIHAMIIMPMN